MFFQQDFTTSNLQEHHFLSNKKQSALQNLQKKKTDLSLNSNPSNTLTTPNTLTNPNTLQLTRHVASSGITTAQGAPKTSRMGPCRAKLISPPPEPSPQRRQGRDRPWPRPRSTVEAQRSDASSWGQNVVGRPMMTGTIYHLWHMVKSGYKGKWDRKFYRKSLMGI